MSFNITHRMGNMEENPSIQRLTELVDELEKEDPEPPDVAISHENGWTLSAFPSGLVVWENLEEGDEPQDMEHVSREEILQLFQALAEGHLDFINERAWTPGYP